MKKKEALEILEEFKRKTDNNLWSAKESLDFLIKSVGEKPSADPLERAKQAILAYNKLLSIAHEDKNDGSPSPSNNSPSL